MSNKLDDSIPAEKVTKKIDDKLTLGMLMRFSRIRRDFTSRSSVTPWCFKAVSERC